MPKYPLKPLLEHRERRVDDATVGLGQAIRSRESAEKVLEHARVARRTAEDAANAIRTDEAGRLARGELRAVDLARGQTWEISARAAAVELDQAVGGAETRVEASLTAEDAARTDLSGRMADRDVVQKDRERFDAEARKRVTEAEEEAADEAFRGRRA